MTMMKFLCSKDVIISVIVGVVVGVLYMELLSYVAGIEKTWVWE